MNIPFVKYQVCGNDFGLLSSDAIDASVVTGASRLFCHRQFGVGADQIVTIDMTDTGVAYIRIFNPDGSISPFCANALLAAGHLCSTSRDRASWTLLLEGSEFFYSHSHGESSLSLPSIVFSEPALAPYVTNSICEIQVRAQTNHYVILLPQDLILAQQEIQRLGSFIERDALPGDTTNVIFVKDTGPRVLEVIPWERGGSGATLACGSGAFSAVGTIMKFKKMLAAQTSEDRLWQINLPGGTLKIEWHQDGSLLFGNPKPVFSGFYHL